MSNSDTYFDGNGDCLVLCDILSRLPVKSLMRFKCVCKRWKWMITRDHYFINLHLNHLKHGTNTTTLLIYPIFPPTSYLQLHRVCFSQKDFYFNDCQGGGSSEITIIPSISCPYFKNDISVSLGLGTSMLKPVYGLVCFICQDGASERRHSVLIYNPSTREKTSWIKIRSKSKALESILGELEESKHNYHEAREFTTQRLRNCMFAFGMDPSTKQHKVLCIYEIHYRLTSSDSPFPDHFKVVCDVMTVGENSWRNIDGRHIPLNISAGTYSIHVNGVIYWIMSSGEDEDEVIMVFDVGTEMFSVIVISNFILDLFHLNGRGRLVNELVEVDGHVSLLVREGNDWLTLWIYSGVAGSNWSKETIQLPCHWSEISYLAFEAIAGTDLIVIKFLPGRKGLECRMLQLRECLHYYNRKEKKFFRNQFEIVLNGGGFYGAHYITTFFETLLPVQTIQNSEDIVK